MTEYTRRCEARCDGVRCVEDLDHEGSHVAPRQNDDDGMDWDNLLHGARTRSCHCYRDYSMQLFIEIDRLSYELDSMTFSFEFVKKQRNRIIDVFGITMFLVIVGIMVVSMLMSMNLL